MTGLRKLNAGLVIILSAVLLSSLLALWQNTAQGAFNQQINYQGKLTNTSFVAVADGTYNMEFKLYTVSSGGSPVWTETRTGGDKVTVSNGLFSVMLGSVTSFAGVDFNQTLYLGVNIGGSGSPVWDGEMTPRKIIGAVPAAFISNSVLGDGRIDLAYAPGDTTSNAAKINYAPTVSSATDAVKILTGSNVTGAALSIAATGTGNLAVLDTTNSSANGLSIDLQSSSASQYALSVTANNGATPGLYVRADGNVGIGTTAPVDPFSIGTAINASATHALFNLSNTALVGGSANGTYIGANPAAFTGNFFDFQVANTSKARLTNAGAFTLNGTAVPTNSAGANVIPKSDGTNLVASRISDITGANQGIQGLVTGDNGIEFDTANAALGLSPFGFNLNGGAGDSSINSSGPHILSINGDNSSIIIDESGLQKTININLASGGSSRIGNDDAFIKVDPGGSQQIILNSGGSAVTIIGDVNTVTNGTTLTVNDATQEILLDSRGGTTTIGDVGGTGNSSTIVVNDSAPSGNVITFNGAQSLGFGATALSPVGTSGALSLGLTGNPFGSLFIGSAATNNIQLTGTATAARVVTLPDATGTIALNSVDNAFTTTQTITSAASVTQTNANPSLSAGTASGLKVITSDTDAPSLLIRNTATAPCVGQFTGCSGAVNAGGEGILTIEGNDGTNTTRYNLITAYNSNTRSATAAVFRVRSDGNVYGEAAFNASGADYAEYFTSTDASLAVGDVVIQDSTEQDQVTKASGSHNGKVIGVVSEHPAFIGNNPGGSNDNQSNQKLVGLLGRIPVKVTNENGNIQPGDFVTTSGTKPGYAMKATQPGWVIGQALQASTAAGEKILVFVNPTYYVPSVATILQNNPSQDLIDLNMTDASAFGNLVVTDTLYIGAKLIVNGSIQAKEIHTDELCVGTVCVTPEQFLKMVQQSNASDSPPAPVPSPDPATTPPGPAPDSSTSSPDTVSP
jgi:hypothetical protein